MADIELVIKLSEESYKATCNGYMLPSDVENVVQGIKNGTLLPKGHGDLIDINEITAFKELECNGHNVEILDEFTVIIESDKED